MIQGSMAGYATKLEAAIEDEVLIDITPYLPEYAPDYWALLENDETFYEAVMNSNYTTSVFNGYGLPIIDNGLVVRSDWMDELGLEDPRTLSDLTDILCAMHDAYGQADSDRVNALAADVLTLYSEKAVLYVMCEISAEEYAAAEEEAMAAGLAECTEIYQKAYDSFPAERG